MSDKYRVDLHDVYARRKSMQARQCGMSKVTDAVVDITKVAVVGSVAMGLLGGINHK